MLTADACATKQRRERKAAPRCVHSEVHEQVESAWAPFTLVTPDAERCAWGELAPYRAPA